MRHGPDHGYQKAVCAHALGWDDSIMTVMVKDALSMCRHESHDFMTRRRLLQSSNAPQPCPAQALPMEAPVT